MIHNHILLQLYFSSGMIQNALPPAGWNDQDYPTLLALLSCLPSSLQIIHLVSEVSWCICYIRCPGWGSAHCEPSSNTIWTQQLILIGCEYAFPSPWTLSTPRPLPTSFSPFLLFPKCCTPRRNIKNIFVNWKTYGNFAKQRCLWISNFLAN